jgi:hypothetical protein
VTCDDPEPSREGIELLLVGRDKTFEGGAHLDTRNGAVIQRGAGEPRERERQAGTSSPASAEESVERTSIRRREL